MGAEALPGHNRLLLNEATMIKAVQEYLENHGGEFNDAVVTKVENANGWFQVHLQDKPNG
jgi:hypothetical protein